MIRRVGPVLLVLALFGSAWAERPPAAPAGRPPDALELASAAVPHLDPWPAPSERAVADEPWRLQAARNANPALKILPLALALPLSVAGVSIHDSAPIAFGLGDTRGVQVMRPTGLSLMAGGMTASLVLNITSRAERAILGGKWNHRFERFAIPVSLMAAGYALTAAGGHPSVMASPGATLGLLIPGAVAWTAGTIFLAIDTMQTALELEPQLTGFDFWVAPTPESLAMGASLRF